MLISRSLSRSPGLLNTLAVVSMFFQRNRLSVALGSLIGALALPILLESATTVPESRIGER